MHNFSVAGVARSYLTKTFDDEVDLVNVRVTWKDWLTREHLTKHTSYSPYIHCPKTVIHKLNTKGHK